MESIDAIEMIDALEDTAEEQVLKRGPHNRDHGAKTLSKTMDLSEELFKSKFRMSKQTFALLHSEVIFYSETFIQIL